MPDSPKAEGPWMIYVCPECGEQDPQPVTPCPARAEPPIFHQVVPLEVIPASALARAEQERDEARRKLVAACVAADGATARANAAESQLAAVREGVKQLRVIAATTCLVDTAELLTATADTFDRLLDSPPSEEPR